ncbi:thiol:disulfide interchange protein DsbA/DsbL [Massilia psychrophila]|jgi:thiol:disulfide interchange protein DsbA|uniref:Thiol:disulfide interchange protein n=1 Tax=Massilia psychrophila TaxID=1603353 RepID=A0A2G8T5B3_9BURK|nr:thiol:disulfide interchange protein DsbA/DsbL [Massilia psychrophila]PIL41163.1 disulfide bond formation protein DsbA [Massilia psychrophila]GGE67029.1 thiol:disulfide interchange protein [Massilia psychrophila]
MRFLRFAIAAIGLVASTAFASPADPKLGAEYVQLGSPQPAQVVGKKVEVIEFFMYHCPHCNVLEPYLAEWVKKQGANINFRRVHMPQTGPKDPEAHLYLTLEAMGKLDDMHVKVFKAIHVDRVRMNTDAVVLDWAVKNGLDKTKFLDAWNSFGVMTKLNRLPSVLNAYKVNSVPTLVVDGRFMTSPSVVDAANKGMNEAALSKATVQVLDGMVAKVAKTK